MIMKNKPRGRGPVVHLDRISKAKMIEAVISDFIQQDINGFRILDIGCGNGGISNFFQRHNEQYGVDIKDQRLPNNCTFHFKQVNSERLPFDDGFFDIIISHHVIEHVQNQGLHLDEIYRTLKGNGLAYLATPNKSSPIMEGHVGNQQVLRLKQMRPLFEMHNFQAHEYSCKLLKEPKKYHGEVKKAYWIPTTILKLLRPLFPSHVFILSKI
jgi:2-polyprenyl-3-methyl-5-hydroxy-6-metoxy-1,4-benzoquinol methylase